ncbi:beta-lactamase family protein [Halobacillus sp. A1]|uniref:serine hydrolase domain-containing protein n=1 Tax=Halobacillus sp. A1 TaxID=2880262 RepID=UPI0020A6497D|nr:serine hydrolase domain-containing protein [Halobacillus sp. A1]MCP3032862.1 beta-lactamase family protein [Halobacillus sp. A1]
MVSTYDHMVSWVEDIKERNKSSAAALTVIKDNEIVLEHFSGTYSNTTNSLPVDENSRFNVASARKSYLGLCIAFALYEGKIRSLDDYASEYFKDLDPYILRHTTIRHMVTHTHGLDENAEREIIREFNPGEKWAYRGINIKLMTQLIQKLYGVPFPEFLYLKVFLPMGWKKTWWEPQDSDDLVKVIIDPDKNGEDTTGSSEDGMESNLFVSAREFALWGNLFLNNGEVNGKQIVPKEVIEIAISIHTPGQLAKEFPRNGMFWFVQDIPREQSELGERVPSGSFQILGVTGPTLLVIPKYKVVVAKMYNKRYNYGNENYLYFLKEFSNIVADNFR